MNAADGGPGAYCTNAGFCRSECASDEDCPCDAVCARSCGLCLRFDVDAGTASPALCQSASLPPSDLLGACQDDLRTLASRARSKLCVGTALRCPSGSVGVRLTLDAGGQDAAPSAADVADVVDAADAGETSLDDATTGED